MIHDDFYGRLKSTLHSVLIVPFYFLRFLYFSLKERSLWFYRYYPGHYGSTIPSAAAIKRDRAALFNSTVTTEDAVDLNAANQEELLRKISSLYADFSPPRTASAQKKYYSDNPKFGFNDGFILYSFMRLFKPSRIIEVGSGYSSALMIDTAEEFLPESRLTFIDPYSTTVGPLLEGTTFKNHEIVRKSVQDVGLEIFQGLKANDILFIDSSHVLKIGSDLSSLLFSDLAVIGHWRDRSHTRHLVPVRIPRDPDQGRQNMERSLLRPRLSSVQQGVRNTVLQLVRGKKTRGLPERAHARILDRFGRQLVAA